MVEHFYVKSGNPSCTGFEISCVKKPIDRQASKRCRCGLRRRGNGEWAEVDEEVGGRLYSRVSTVVVCTTFMFVVYAAATNSTRCTNDTLAEWNGFCWSFSLSFKLMYRSTVWSWIGRTLNRWWGRCSNKTSMESAVIADCYWRSPACHAAGRFTSAKTRKASARWVPSVSLATLRSLLTDAQGWKNVVFKKIWFRFLGF